LHVLAGDFCFGVKSLDWTKDHSGGGPVIYAWESGEPDFASITRVHHEMLKA
jgi:hypothetical protein